MVPCVPSPLLWVPVALAPGKHWVLHGRADRAGRSWRNRTLEGITRKQFTASSRWQPVRCG